MRVNHLMLGLAVTLALGNVHADCGGGDPPAVASCNLPTGQTECVSDDQCSDGVFCNGIERCAAVGTPGASSCGCILAATPSCSGATPVCDETARSCRPEGCDGADADRDGDGHRSIACRGDDCDDNDANRFPGRMEVCDASHDEDCDPTTFGDRDVDQDGAVDAVCCDASGSAPVCGTDCDDTNAAINRGNPEVCNGFDDNCSGAIDEGVTQTYFFDADDDGFGETIQTIQACTPPAGFSPLSGDCDDDVAGIVPGAFRCDPFKANQFEQCSSDVFVVGFCPGTQTCHAQPNGSGVCF